MCPVIGRRGRRGGAGAGALGGGERFDDELGPHVAGEAPGQAGEAREHKGQESN
jgi:hypothetical protein